MVDVLLHWAGLREIVTWTLGKGGSPGCAEESESRSTVPSFTLWNAPYQPSLFFSASDKESMEGTSEDQCHGRVKSHWVVLSRQGAFLCCQCEGCRLEVEGKIWVLLLWSEQNRWKGQILDARDKHVTFHPEKNPSRRKKKKKRKKRRKKTPYNIWH